MTLSNNYSTIYYKNLDGKAKTLVLPTIQSLSIPDNTAIPCKPTITGEFRNQYVIRNALKVTFTAWLENGRFGEETLDVSESIDQLEYLKKNRIKFNLSTTQEAEESRFLADLVIENISYSREAARRDRVVAVVNCVQVKLIDLTWKLASSIEIFGKEIFTNAEEAAKTTNMNFVAGVTDTDFELSNNAISALFTRLGDISGYKDMPVNRHIRNSIEDAVPLNEDSYYYKLGSPIDMSAGTRAYNCACSFKSRYGAGSDEPDYTVSLGTFVVNITQKSVDLVDNFPIKLYLDDNVVADIYNFMLISRANSRDVQRIKNSSPTCSYPYDFADTYPDFTVSKSFDYIAGNGELIEYLYKCYNNHKFSSDDNALTTGSVILKNGYVYTYKISDRYEYTVSYGSFNKQLIPDGALKIDTFELTTQNSGFTAAVSNESYQDIWNNLFSSNYKIYLVTVTLGAMLQLYLFSPTLFNQNKISSSV